MPTTAGPTHGMPLLSCATSAVAAGRGQFGSQDRDDPGVSVREPVRPRAHDAEAEADPMMDPNVLCDYENCHIREGPAHRGHPPYKPGRAHRLISAEAISTVLAGSIVESASSPCEGDYKTSTTTATNPDGSLMENSRDEDSSPTMPSAFRQRRLFPSSPSSDPWKCGKPAVLPIATEGTLQLRISQEKIKSVYRPTYPDVDMEYLQRRGGNRINPPMEYGKNWLFGGGGQRTIFSCRALFPRTGGRRPATCCPMQNPHPYSAR